MFGLCTGASIPPNNQGAFSSLPLFPQSFSALTLFPSCNEAAPLNQLEVWGSTTSILVFSEREKNLFNSNYYMDFCILKFVELLIKFPPPPQKKKIVLGAFVAKDT